MNNALTAILDFFFPRHCVMCGRPLYVGERPICVHCNLDLPRTYLWKEPYTNHLATRFYGKTNMAKVAAYMYYYSHTDIANLVYSFKYWNEPEVAVQIGEFMALDIEDSGFFNDIDYLIPIPLNHKKKNKRGYNQSEKLAQGISKVTGIEIITNTVERSKNTVTQTQKNHFDRYENMKNVFKATKHATKLIGKHCLLIDDVITTGSTTSACAEALENIQDISLSVLGLACVKHIK